MHRFNIHSRTLGDFAVSHSRAAATSALWHVFHDGSSDRTLCWDRNSYCRR